MNNLRARILTVCTTSFPSVLALVFAPRIPQSINYHSLADQRTCFNIHNCFNVVSNLPFLFVGLLGLRSLRTTSASKSKIVLSTTQEKSSYFIFFLGILLTAFGSAYYHFTPSNNTLVWDRMPMTLVFLSLLAATIPEHINLPAGLRLLFPLVAFGIARVFYWQRSELLGRGDPRPYLFAQFFPSLIIPVIILLFSPRYTRGGDELGVFAALAAYLLFRMLRLRSQISHVNSAATTR